MRSRGSINSLEVNNRKLNTESIAGIYMNFLHGLMGPAATLIGLKLRQEAWFQQAGTKIRFRK